MTTAVVVGSGPNGLTAAVRLARAGVTVRVVEAADRIGGGTRTSELTGDGLLHDDCAAFHPSGMTSPAFRALDLAAYGLRWAEPEIQLAHPLDDGRAALLWRDLDRTAEGLGRDGRPWRRTFGPLASGFDELADDVYGPLLGLPSHPLRLARFGLDALRPASWVARRWRDAPARALFGGVAAHGFVPLSSLGSAAVGIMLTAAGHAAGWPVALGGSQAITDALVAALAAHGGTIETGRSVTDYEQLDDPDLALLCVSPRAALGILGDRLPAGVARAYRRYRYGPAVHKVDFAVRDGIPWANPDVGRAGTVHVGGTFEEISATERTNASGRVPERPFLLVGQQYLVDPARSVGDLHPVWAYAHVPAGYRGDATEALIAQIERYAPGFRARIVRRHVRTAPQIEAYNPNYVGGDIAVGANDLSQVLLRPRLTIDPYATGVPGVYLCSSATPPGAGVHGMCGWHAAGSALRHAGLADPT